MITLDDQIKEAQRELAMRKATYPSWVKTGRLTQGQADYQLIVQEAIIASLKALADAAQADLFSRKPWQS